MEKKQKMLQNAPYRTLLIHLCVPTVVVMLVLIIYNMADTFFIGQTGDPYKVAAISLSAPLFSILSGIGTLLGSGGCTAISLALGKGEYEKIKSYTSVCCYLALSISIIFAIVIQIFAFPIALLFGADDNTLTFSVQYIRIVSLGSPVILFVNVFANVIRSDGSAKESMISNLMGTFSNILLDALFILVFSMDVAGAAIATILGNCISFLYLVYFIQRKQAVFSLSVKHCSLHKDILLPLLTLGLPMAFSTILMSFSSVISNNYLMKYGAIALAANGVSGKIGMLLSMTAMGLCMGMQPAISYNYSSSNLKRMYSIIKKTALFTLILGSLLTILCFLGKDIIIAAFIDNTEVISMGQILILGSLCSGPIYGLLQLCTSFLQATGKASYAAILAILDKGLFYLPMLYLFNRYFGLYGIAFAGTGTTICSLAAAFVLSLRWSNKIKSMALTKWPI